MTVTAAAVVNRALELAARNVQVTGPNPTFDGTPAGNAAGVLYTPSVQLMLRLMNPVFARRTATLASSGGTAPPGWLYSLTYPADCLRVRSFRPAPGSYSANDPQPVRGAVYFDNGLSLKCLASNLSLTTTAAVYTTNVALETQWDDEFAEAVARRLANPMAMALSGRPDFSRELLEDAERAAAAAEFSDEL